MSPNKSVLRTYPNLETWRREHGLSQRQAAKALGVSQTKYCRLERKMLTATGELAKRIIKETRVPIETLVGLA